MTDITLPRSVVEKALKALYEADSLMEHHTNIELRRSALVELRAALEQPQGEQEPVAYFYTRSGRVVSTEATDALMQQMIGESGRVALYAHPQPPRQPLTDEEILRVKGQFNGTLDVQFDRFARAIERAHGIGGEA